MFYNTRSPPDSTDHSRSTRSSRWEWITRSATPGRGDATPGRGDATPGRGAGRGYSKFKPKSYGPIIPPSPIPFTPHSPAGLLYCRSREGSRERYFFLYTYWAHSPIVDNNPKLFYTYLQRPSSHLLRVWSPCFGLPSSPFFKPNGPIPLQTRILP